MWTDILSACLGGDLQEIGWAQQVFGDRQQVSFIGGHKSIIADFDEAFWQYMLQEAVDEIKGGQGCCFPLVGVAVFKAEGDLIIFELFDAVVGDSDSVDIRGQVF